MMVIMKATLIKKLFKIVKIGPNCSEFESNSSILFGSNSKWFFSDQSYGFVPNDPAIGSIIHCLQFLTHESNIEFNWLTVGSLYSTKMVLYRGMYSAMNA
jgi:hypothetical protein